MHELGHTTYTVKAQHKETQNKLKPPPTSGLLAGVKSSGLSAKSLQASSLHLYGPFLFQFTLLPLFLRLGQPFSKLFFSVCTYRLPLLV